MPLSFDKFEEHIFLNTVLIENLTDGESGTGFIIRKPITETRGKVLLFSNKHVFWGKKDWKKEGITKKLRLTFHVKEEDGSHVLGSVKQFIFNLQRGQEGYYDHKLEDIDVACVNVSSFFNLAPLHVSPIELERYSDYKLEDLSAGSPICFVGYPKLFYDKANYLPIFRTGIAASIPSVDFEGRSVVLVDAPVYPGSSGSPVFVTHSGKYRLLGIMSQAVNSRLDFVSDEVSGEALASTPVQWLNIGLVYKLQTIKDVYEKA